MTQADLRQIVFVTRHYRALRDGLSRAVLAPGLLLGFGLFQFFSPLAEGLILALAVVLIFGPLLLGRWIDRRFGLVRAGRFHPMRWDVDLGIPVWLAAVYLDVQGRGAGRPSIAFLALAAYGLWLVVKLRPHGFHNLLPTIVALFAALAFAGASDGVSTGRWEISAVMSTLLAWTVAGLFDLRRLVRSLPRRSAQGLGNEC